MHVLTKVFVVAAAVLSVALAALTMAYATNAERIRGNYQEQVQLATAAEAALAAERARIADQRADFNARIESLNRDKADQLAQIQRLQSESTDLQIRLRDAQTARESVENKIAQLGETTRTQAELITAYRDEVTGLRENELRFRKEKLDLEDRVADLESQREVLEQTTRALQEQLADLRVTDAGASGAAPAARGAVQEVAYSGPPIQGRVQQVATDSARGGMLARVNLGSNDNIAPGMRLIVARNGDFVGHLVIVETDLQWSVGEFSDLGRGKQVRTGDEVWTSLQ